QLREDDGLPKWDERQVARELVRLRVGVGGCGLGVGHFSFPSSVWSFCCLELNALLALACSWFAIGGLVCHLDGLRSCLRVLACELVRDLIQEVRRVAELK